MRFPALTGDASRRIHGVHSALLDRAATATVAVGQLPEGHAKAAMRGKVAAYREAARMVAAVEYGGRIPWGKAWHRKRANRLDVTRIPAEQFDRLMESDEPEPAPALQRAAEQYRAHRSGEKSA